MSRIRPINDPDREAYQLGESFLRGEVSRRDFLTRASQLAISTPVAAALLAAQSGAVRAQGTSFPPPPEPNADLTGQISSIANTGAGAESEAWNKRIDDFIALYPNVQVERLENVGQTFYALLPTVETMIAGGNAPDTIRVGNYSGAMFAARDALLPLDDFIANDPDVDWDDFYPAAQEAFKLDGKIFALPENGESYGINYNRSAFQAKGLPDPREQWDAGEWTNEAFLAAAQALTEGEGPAKKWGFLYESWHSENWIFFNGGTVLKDDLATVEVDLPAAYEGLQWAADLVNVHGVAPNPETPGFNPIAQFQAGNGLMYMLGGWYIANFAKDITAFEYATAGPPIGAAGKTSKLEISGYAIAKESQNPEVAWEFIKYITGPYGQETWSVVGMPTRQRNLEKFIAESPNATYYEPFVEVLTAVRHSPFFARSQEIAQILTEEQSAVFAGSAPAETQMATAAQRMRDVLAG
jgi:multiple sugar transport system substrate-binding protein